MSKVVRSLCGGGRKAIVAFLVAVVVLSLAGPMFGQTANGRISGTVKDQTGGAIVGAAVTVTDVARGLARNLTTDDAGAYLAPNLIPGQYSVRATFTGFQAWERTNITLGVSQDLFIDVVLQPGAQTTTVTITEEIPLVNTTSSTMGGTLTGQTIVDLPISGRNYINLLELRPGTVAQIGNNSNGGGPVSTNGLRSEASNTYAVEGVTGIDPYTGQSVINNIGVNGDAASLLSSDAIQEFNQQFNSKAENGSKAGSNVSVGLKSGTNALHGTAYGFFRDESMDSLNYYQPYDTVAGQRTPIKIKSSLQQFGGTVGGPIKQDKMFFFVAYEQMRQRVGNPRSISAFFTDPGMLNCTGAGATYACTAKTGLFPNILGGTQVPDASNHAILACLGIGAATRSPQSLALLGMSPNCELLGGTSGSGKSYSAGQVNPDFFVNHGANDHGAQSSNNPTIPTMYPGNLTRVMALGGLSKIDYTVNDKNSINGFVFIGTGERFDGLGNQPSERYLTNFRQFPRMVAGTWTWLPNASVANSFRIGYASLNQPNHGADVLEGFTAAQLGLNTGVTDSDHQGVPEQLALSGYYTIGSRQTDLQGPGRSLEISDSVSYLRGNHALKFGGSVIRDNQDEAVGAFRKGLFGFGRGASGASVASGLVGLIVGQAAIPGTVGGIAVRSSTTGLESAQIIYGNTFAKALRWNLAGFVQDDWRVTPRLTLNLGVRYDVSSVLTTREKYMGTVDLSLPGGVAQEGINTPRVYNADRNNFGPRAGFAWDIFGTGKTVLRGGGSIVYELNTLRTYLEVGNDLGLPAPPSGFVTGCSITPYADQSGAAGFQLAAGDLDNCTGTLGGTRPGGTLTTPGGNRSVGNVLWQRGDNNIVGNVLWDRASPTTSTIYPNPNAVRLNCNPTIAIAEAGGAARTGATCTNIASIDRFIKTPYVETWSIGVQHAIVSNVLLDVAYIGNHGVNLLGKNNPNQALLGAGWGLGPTGTAAGTALRNACLASQTSGTCTDPDPALATTLRPQYTRFPWMGTIVNLTNGDVSNYNSLQSSLTMRNFHGLSLVSGYTWSHGLEMSANNNGGLGLDTYQRRLDYGEGGQDLRHKFSLSPSYAIPSVAGYYGLLEGWKVSSVFRYQTGRSVSYTSGLDLAGTGRGNRWNLSGDAEDFETDETATFVGVRRNVNLAQYYPGCSVAATTDPTCSTLPSGTNPRTGVAYVAADMAVNNTTCTTGAASVATLRAFGCWVQGSSALTPPALGTYGNAGKGTFRGLSLWLLDLSVSKRQKFTERISAEFRAEAFNILNHPIFAQPAGGITTSCTTSSCGFQTVPLTTPDVAASNPVLGSGGPRRMQLGVKIIF